MSVDERKPLGIPHNKCKTNNRKQATQAAVSFSTLLSSIKITPLLTIFRDYTGTFFSLLGCNHV